jgi:hypothetical protein
MGSNIEKKIQDEFSKREIQPSKSAWEILQLQLDAKVIQKKKNHFKYLSYAAIFVGLLFGLLFFLNGNDSNNPQKNIPEIVDVKKNKEKESNKTLEKNKIDLPQEDQIVKTNKAEIKNSTNNSKNQQIQKTTKYNEVLANNETKTSQNEIINTKSSDKKIALISENDQSVAVNSDNKKSSDTEIKQEENTFNTEKIASVQAKKRRKLMLSTDSDIDQLLASALKNNTKTKIENVQLQSDALQFAAESDMKQSLSKKVYKTLVTGVHTVDEYLNNNN